MKRFDTGAFDVASEGIASLPLGLSTVWTEARRRGHTLIDVVRWMAESPSGQAGFTTKGHIAPGTPPTPRCSRPVEVLVVDKTKLHHKNPISAYDGLPLPGVMSSSWLAGQRINLGETPRGRLLARGPPDLGANAIHTLISRTR